MREVLSFWLLSACLSISVSCHVDRANIDSKANQVIGGTSCRYKGCRAHMFAPPINGSHIISALDCRFPKSVKTGLLSQICRNNKEEQKEDVRDVLLLQYSLSHVAKAVRCCQRESRLNAIWGAFSHTKVLEPPDILIPAMFSVEDCNRAVHQGIYNEESGHSLPVQKNNRYHYNITISLWNMGA